MRLLMAPLTQNRSLTVLITRGLIVFEQRTDSNWTELELRSITFCLDWRYRVPCGTLTGTHARGVGRSSNVSLCKNIKKTMEDAGIGTLRDLGRNLASWTCTYSRDEAQTF
ncbi:uncharacterized protein LOC117160651 [Bombus vancouverensis nearcticus]|uniref:uncharacterized protein LOC117160651 n=1 Tax=Bombus vancouverensis nearcticus TaxID=2705178 RepID=UPI00223A0767